MGRILVVEDERDLAELLAYNLKQADFEVDVAHNGARALELAKEKSPDLVILDLMLPDISGTSVCETLRQRPQSARTPILMLTAKGAEEDRIRGFEAGADDYVVKPFSPKELILRVQAILRRSALPPETSTLQAGNVRIDIEKYEVRVSGALLELTPIEFKLLADLIAHKGFVQSRDKLLERVWTYQTGVETRTVDTHVKRLREKLGKQADIIDTVRGVGYRVVKD